MQDLNHKAQDAYAKANVQARILKKEDREMVCRWEIEFESGDDGCMPQGWYLMGIDRIGNYITYPIRHEYGPYETKASAEMDSEAICLNYAHQ